MCQRGNNVSQTTESDTVQPISQANIPPTALTIFGISGNLSKTKLLPALYNLLQKNMLPETFVVVGIFRQTSIDLDRLMQQVEINLLRKHQEADSAILAKLRQLIIPVTMDSTNPEDFQRLKQTLDDLDSSRGTTLQRLFYLAIPPNIFPSVIGCLKTTGLNVQDPGTVRRILVEKPFGTNLQTAKDLVNTMAGAFSEDQIYRIDHYLAKENAQNILTFRFNNPFIADIWEGKYIDHIQITASEQIGIDSRSNFYEGMGALRDFIQSHLLQLMTLVMMEEPTQLTSKAIHDNKLAFLNNIQPIPTDIINEQTARGQYAGYRTEVDNPSSMTETYAAIRLEVTNERWHNTPVIIRTGKGLAEAKTEISLVFNDKSGKDIPPNILKIRIQPNEGITISLTAKKPGFTNELQPVNMSFNYTDNFTADNPDAYERVIVDTILGDQSLFSTSDEVLRSWEILESVIEYWQSADIQPEEYEMGSPGPASAEKLATGINAEWL